MDAIRNGNFTSSDIVKLTTSGTAKDSYGVPFYNYIEECNRERRLGRALEEEIDSKPTSWGKLLEKRGFDALSIDYTLCSSKTLSHHTIDFWKGSPDAVKELDDVLYCADLKCPKTLNSFCQLVDPYIEKGNKIFEGLTIDAVRKNHKDGNKYYWQIVSNCIITGAKIGELVIYLPYIDELDKIRLMAEGRPDCYWIQGSTDDQLPHLIRGGHYKNINVIEFEIPESDIDFLTERVKKAGELLTPWIQ
jgi:hypothetical protein